MEIEKLNKKYVLLLQHWLVIALLFILVLYSISVLCMQLLLTEMSNVSTETVLKL